MKGRDDRSSGIEIRIADALAKINPTDPLILAKQDARRNLNCSDSSASKQVYFQLNKKKGEIRLCNLSRYNCEVFVYYESIKRKLI
jgi:hypothetical protein